MKHHTVGKAAGSALMAALMLGGANIAFAQTYANPDGTGSIIPTTSTSLGTDNGGGTTTTGTTGTTGTGTTPGIPNTGAGDPATWTVLGIAAAIAAGGGALLFRQRQAFN